MTSLSNRGICRYRTPTRTPLPVTVRFELTALLV